MSLTSLFEHIQEFAREARIENLKRDDRFAAWWLAATLIPGEDAEKARESLTDPTRDGGVDAVYVDDDEKHVYIIQTKARLSLSHREERKEVGELTRWASLLTGPEDRFRVALADVLDRTRERLERARSLVWRNHSCEMQFVTTGRAAGQMISSQRQMVDETETAAGDEFRFRFFNGTHVLQVYEDYLHGARLIPELTLSVIPDHLRDNSGSIDLGIMLASADEIADAVKRYKERLFARNIRGFVGTRNPVNSEIRQTIAEAPNDFKFLNNGLTIVCERMQFTTDGRRNRVTLSKPSVVNGQQTATTLRLARDVPQSDVPGEEPRTLSLAGIKVPIRVIVVDRNRSEGDAYQDFISAVVKATNFQTKVTIPDLYANNWRQVDLGRRMRRAGFYYARKNETKTESRRQAGGRPIVDRRVLADAVGGCVEESLPHRLTKEMLYKEGVDAEVGNYEKIFDVSKPVEFFLTRYYLWQIVRDVLKGGIVDKPQEVGKWLVLFDIEQRIGRALDTRPTRFMTEAVSSGGTDDDTIAYCRTLVELLGEAVARFYERRHGTGQLPDDIAGFFKTRNLQPTFRAFLRSNGNRGREQRIGRAVADFRASLTM